MPHSRLQSHEQKVLLRQTLLFFGSGIGLIVVFLFLILPGFIRVMALRNLGYKAATNENTILPSRPTLEQPFDATSSASLALSGSAQPNSKVILLQNGAPGPETHSDDTGSFTFEAVTLDSGDNTFTAVVENEQSVRSNPSGELHISFVKDAPKLEIETPTENLDVTKRRDNPISVKGKTDAGNKVTINDRVLFVANDGSFSGAVQLSDGDNTIVIKATNAALIETVEERHVRFVP